VSTISPSRTFRPFFRCYNFLYGFKGAPSARHAPREGANTEGVSSAAGMTGHQRPGSPVVSPLRGGSFARALRAVALRRGGCRARQAPPPAATGPRRNGPDAARQEQDQAVSVAPCAPVAGRKITGSGPERHALSGSAPPASTVLRIPLRGTRLRRAVDPGDLGRPSGA
jgi:hypothetical protein